MSKLKTFNESLLSPEGKFLVKFGAPWCAPCKIVEPMLEKLADEGFTIYEVNTDEQPDLAVKYGIRSVPTFVVFDGGTEVRRKSGPMTKPQLLEILN